jgi:hypothetical protein
VVDFLDFGDSRFESMNKDKAKQELRSKHSGSGSRSYGSKDSGSRSYGSKDRKYSKR